ncbi:MAG: hypothetical protein JO265_16615, partial [Acidimicrobiia bacterium]|nr:hypothetical protein [Acidimicrobiia bacterium]
MSWRRRAKLGGGSSELSAAEGGTIRGRRPMRARAVAGRGLAAGLLLTASVPPFGWWLLGLAGAALLADTLVRLDRARMRLLAGAAAGLTLYAVGWFWMSEF